MLKYGPDGLTDADVDEINDENTMESGPNA